MIELGGFARLPVSVRKKSAGGYVRRRQKNSSLRQAGTSLAGGQDGGVLIFAVAKRLVLR